LSIHLVIYIVTLVQLCPLTTCTIELYKAGIHYCTKVKICEILFQFSCLFHFNAISNNNANNITFYTALFKYKYDINSACSYNYHVLCTTLFLFFEQSKSKKKVIILVFLFDFLLTFKKHLLWIMNELNVYHDDGNFVFT
jgi:hypothetical protein